MSEKSQIEQVLIFDSYIALKIVKITARPPRLGAYSAYKKNMYDILVSSRTTKRIPQFYIRTDDSNYYHVLMSNLCIFQIPASSNLSKLIWIRQQCECINEREFKSIQQLVNFLQLKQNTHSASCRFVKKLQENICDSDNDTIILEPDLSQQISNTKRIWDIYKILYEEVMDCKKRQELKYRVDKMFNHDMCHYYMDSPTMQLYIYMMYMLYEPEELEQLEKMFRELCNDWGILNINFDIFSVQMKLTHMDILAKIHPHII